MGALFDPFINFFTTWRKILKLKKEKRRWLSLIPTCQFREFEKIHKDIKKGNGTRERKKKLLKLWKELDNLGLRKINEKIIKINKEIKDLKK